MKFQERNYANQTTNIRPTMAETPLSFHADLIVRFRLGRTVALFLGCKVATYRCTLEKRRCLREICKSGESTMRGMEEGKIQRSERKRNERSDERRRGEKRDNVSAVSPCGILHLRGTRNPTFCDLLVSNVDRSFIYGGSRAFTDTFSFSFGQAFATNFLLSVRLSAKFLEKQTIFYETLVVTAGSVLELYLCVSLWTPLNDVSAC